MTSSIVTRSDRIILEKYVQSCSEKFSLIFIIDTETSFSSPFPNKQRLDLGRSGSNNPVKPPLPPKMSASSLPQAPVPPPRRNRKSCLASPMPERRDQVCLISWDRERKTESERDRIFSGFTAARRMFVHFMGKTAKREIMLAMWLKNIYNMTSFHWHDKKKPYDFFLIKNIDSCVWCLTCVPWTMDFLISCVMTAFSGGGKLLTAYMMRVW